MFKLYSKMVVSFPIHFLVTIPIVLSLIAAAITPYKIELLLSFGECDFLNISFPIYYSFVVKWIGLLMIPTSMAISVYVLIKSDIKDRLNIYNKWKISAYLGFIPLFLATLGAYCNSAKMNFFNLNGNAIIALFIANIFMIRLAYIVKKDYKVKLKEE